MKLLNDCIFSVFAFLKYMGIYTEDPHQKKAAILIIS